MPTRFLASLLCSGLVLLFAAGGAVAQSFAPVAQVNDGYITAWELEQRQRMLRVLNAPPEAQAEALDTLINEKIQLQAAEAVGATVSDEAIQAGIEDFASRGGLDADQFLQLISREGVDPETIRTFVRAGLAWREAVQTRFEGQVTITADDVARERETVRQETGPRVLLSEIILPSRNEIERIDSGELAERISAMRSVSAFSAAAREYSTASSAEDGGMVDWIPLSDLQGPVAVALEGLSPGQVTAPIAVPDGIALFQLRARSESPVRPGDTVIDYAQYLIPGGRTESTLREAARIEARADTCDDLYTVARRDPPDRLIREQRAQGQIPSDIAAALSGLDRYEVSTTLTRGNALVFLMLCERGVSGELAIEETAFTARLRSEELTGLARIWLAELKAAAYIRIGGE